MAGIVRERMVFNMTEAEWDDVIRVHLRGTFATTHFASIHWRERREYGRLINFTSSAGIKGTPGQPNYAAAKAGIIGFTRSCANALVRYNVTANCIAPVASTRMDDRVAATGTEGAPPSERSAGTERDPMNVAPAVVFLASEGAGNISGRTFAASGYHIGLYSEPQVEKHIYSDGPWNLDQLFEIFPPHISRKSGAARALRDNGNVERAVSWPTTESYQQMLTWWSRRTCGQTVWTPSTATGYPTL